MKNKVIITLNLTLIILIFQNNLESQTLFEVAKQYANIIYKYDELWDYNSHLFMQKVQITRNSDFDSYDSNSNFDSIGKSYRLKQLLVQIDTIDNFKEIKIDLETKTKLNYFEFTDIKPDALGKRYMIAIDSTYIIYKLANFIKNDFDVFYTFELKKDSLNYLKFIKLYYNELISFRNINYVGIDSSDIVKAKFKNLNNLVYEDKIEYIHIKGNITTLVPYGSKKINFKLYQYNFKFFEDRFEQSYDLINEETVLRKSTR